MQTTQEIPLPPGYDADSPMDRLCRYHLWQALVDWRERNYPTIGQSILAHEEAVLIHAEFDGLDLTKTFDLFRTWSRWLKYDSELSFRFQH